MLRIPALALFLLCVALVVPATSTAATPGIQTHLLWGGVDAADRERQLDWAAEAGAKMVRVDVGWMSLQDQGPNSWNSWYLNKVDHVVAEAKERGIKPLFTLTWTPCWASTAPSTKKLDCTGSWWDRGVQYYAPANMSDYANAMAFLARRYGSDVAAWEIWNEPNSSYYFQAPDRAVAYAQMVNATVSVVKAAAPDAKLVAGSLEESDTGFIDRLYAAGMKNGFDAFSIHPYAGAISPLDPLSPQYAMYTFAAGPPLVREALLKRGADVPIWFTEFGWSVNLTRDAEIWRNGVSEATQAEYLKLAYEKAKEWSWAETAFWFNMRDTSSDPYDVWGNAGLRRKDNTARPAFYAFKEVATAVDPTPPAPTPEEPAPTPTEPAPSEPAPSEPAPSEPVPPAEPAPSEPVVSEPAPSEPAPSEPAPAPAPSEPVVSEPAPEEPTTTTPTKTRPVKGGGKKARTSSVKRCMRARRAARRAKRSGREPSARVSRRLAGCKRR